MLNNIPRLNNGMGTNPNSFAKGVYGNPNVKTNPKTLNKVK